jgi:CBS-domain-containing membrane protein
VCRECASCIAIEGERGDENEVHCSPPPGLVMAGALSAGAALSRGVVVIDETTLVRDVVALFVERRLRMLVVADAMGRTQGVVHESHLLRQIQDHAHARPGAVRLGCEATSFDSASTIASTPVTVLESSSLRDAITRMATAHQRQLVVVDEQGFPIGLLTDVDALHGLHAKTPNDEQP